MRPKKVILIVDADPSRVSVLCTVLRVHGYKAVPAADYEAARGVLAQGPRADLLLAREGSGFTADQDLGRLTRGLHNAYYLPAILFGQVPAGVDARSSIEALVVRESCPVGILLQHVKSMSTRRRGPRKGARRAIPADVAQAEAVA